MREGSPRRFESIRRWHCYNSVLLARRGETRVSDTYNAGSESGSCIIGTSPIVYTVDTDGNRAVGHPSSSGGSGWRIANGERDPRRDETRSARLSKQ